MLHAVEPADLLPAFAAAAAVILCGAGYAGLFAWSKLRRKRILMSAAYAAYGFLAGAVCTLAWLLHLHGFWAALVAAMLLGYLFAPHLIWRLCVGTHAPGRDAPYSER